MNEAKKELTKIASVIYNEEATYGDIFDAIQAYKSLLLKGTTLNLDSVEADRNIFTPSGKAIGTRWAGRCVDDFYRTLKFCRGVYKAVSEKRKSNPSRKTHILYIGTGPFAPLILPLTTVFTQEEIEFTLLEINELSVKSLRDTLSYFEIESYVKTIEICDATTYNIENEVAIDVVVVEAMMFSLKKEPQVSISYNIINQLPKETILIPENIALNLLAVNSEIRNANKLSMEEAIPYSKKLGTLFLLNKDEIYKNATVFIEGFPDYEFPEKKVKIPKNTVRSFDELHVETHITIYKDEKLEVDECGLTVLDKFHQFKAMMLPPKYLVSTYMCGKKPGLYFNFRN